MANIENAIISRYDLGHDEHGSIVATAKFESSSGRWELGPIPVYNLSASDEIAYKNYRCGHFVDSMLRVAGVEHLSEIVGKPARIERVGGEVVAVGNFLHDYWYEHKQDYRPSVENPDNKVTSLLKGE